MELPAPQAAIRAKCGLASPTFTPFPADAVEQSPTQRFKERARRFPRQLAIRTRTPALTYGVTVPLRLLWGGSTVARMAEIVPR
jgi:hypothetical protein